ncbi:MAG TPA: DUF4019 domain-containing protein [Pyrinomonadaceae bacterium]
MDRTLRRKHTRAPARRTREDGFSRPLSAVVVAARLVALALFVSASFFGAACSVDERRSGIPTDAQAAIDQLTEHIAAGRDELIYREAADEWRQAVTPEQNAEILEGVRRLGKVESRTYQTGIERQYGTSAIDGHTLDLRYETTFQRASGMETFTLVKRDGRWLLARYSVNAGKQ